MAETQVHLLTEDHADLLEAFAAVNASTDREVNPADPPAPVAEVTGELFHSGRRERRLGWVATVDGVPAGGLQVTLEDIEENRHRADIEWLAVVPELRRRGVADDLLRACLADGAMAGRTSLTFWVPVLPDGAGLAYAARCGTTRRMQERCSRLVIEDLAEDLVDGWLEQGRRRTDGYRIVQWVGRTPDEHLAHMAGAHRAMEDMPIDDLEWTIPTVDEEDLRSWDDAWEGRGQCPVITLALSPDGEPAGFSALFLNRHRPQLAAQGDTGVLEDHRGRRLGRWLKAENIRLGLETEPRIRVVQTFNAESNPWMLDINVAMGFRPHVGYEAWQGDVGDVRAVLGA